MQAIILAAGMGKRLKELTKNNTKCMIKVHNQTLIERMLKQLEALSLKRIIIVIGYKGEKVRELIGGCVVMCLTINQMYMIKQIIYTRYISLKTIWWRTRQFYLNPI